MGIDAFVIRYRTDDTGFLAFLLKSGDFSLEALRNICNKHNLIPSGSKSDLAERISLAAVWDTALQESIVESFVERPKPWLVFKIGNVSLPQRARDPNQLLFNKGEPEWYGPIKYGGDSNATWYLRPVFVDNWEILDNFDGPQQTTIRWMVFARIENGILSYHWRGFSYTETSKDILKQNMQFPYWEHIPKLMAEFEEGISVHNLSLVPLHNLILHDIWDHYRYDTSYEWRDLRIRAESGGVALTARASAAIDVDIPGIRRLANTIRRSIDRQLAQETGRNVLNSDLYDEIILRTLIRELGALSYEFSLQYIERANILFRGHIYFGLRQNTKSPDSFNHIHLHTSSRPEIEQMHFLIDFLENNRGQSSQAEQARLLP